MKLHRLIQGIIALALCVVAYNLALAQAPTERAASGNAPSASAGARIDMTNDSVRRFIAGQEGLITGVQTNVNTTNGTILARLGQMRSTLVAFNPAGGCDPALGPHGCACACSGPDQKLLWNGNAWQCYRAEQQCPQGADGRPQTFNPETCQCETCTDCPVLTCDPPLIVIGTGQTTSCGGQAGMCACISSGRRPHNGLEPSLMPYIHSFSVDSLGCPTGVQCKNGMQYSEQQRSCCCGDGQAILNGSCGNVCPAGTLFQPGMAGGYELAGGYCFTVQYRTVQNQQECRGSDERLTGNNSETCGGGSGMCCEARTRAPYTPFGRDGRFAGCITR
jgi:hypothetical protein